MDRHVELKERREANECATHEFVRVKRAKLEDERAKVGMWSPGSEDVKKEKQKDREMANRASAAASRAKIMFYNKELERRTDRLEMERNKEVKRADRASRKLKALRDEILPLKRALREIWEMKDQRTCSYLMSSDVLFLLGSKKEDTDLDSSDSDESMGFNRSGVDTSNTPAQPVRQLAPSPLISTGEPGIYLTGAASTTLQKTSAPSPPPPTVDKDPPRSTRSPNVALHNLIHPTPVVPPIYGQSETSSLFNSHRRNAQVRTRPLV